MGCCERERDGGERAGPATMISRTHVKVRGKGRNSCGCWLAGHVQGALLTNVMSIGETAEGIISCSCL